jgi:hypothetical protein
MTAATGLPGLLPVGHVQSFHVGGGEILLIGTAPNGLPAIISPDDWQLLCRWKLDSLRIVSGHVRACGGGGNSRPLVARFLTNTMSGGNVVVRYRNGNPLDLRRSNIAVVPRGVLLQIEKEKNTPLPTNNTVTLRDGRVRTRRKPKYPNAAERLREMLRLRT